MKSIYAFTILKLVVISLIITSTGCAGVNGRIPYVSFVDGSVESLSKSEVKILDEPISKGELKVALAIPFMGYLFKKSSDKLGGAIEIGELMNKSTKEIDGAIGVVDANYRSRIFSIPFIYASYQKVMVEKVMIDTKVERQ